MCHGLDGVGDFAGAFPRLTGQAAFYMYKQLADYASGARPDEVMSPIAREMSEAQMADVAFYYSALEAPMRRRPWSSPSCWRSGRRLAEDGRRDDDLPACNLCHGRDGSGDPPLFPYLAGQYAPYAELQLQRWQQGVRRNDALDVMAQIAEALSAEDIRAVALYYETLRPAGGAAARAVTARRRRRLRRRARAPGPAAAAGREPARRLRRGEAPAAQRVLHGNPELGRALIAARGCTACHAIPGIARSPAASARRSRASVAAPTSRGGCPTGR